MKLFLVRNFNIKGNTCIRLRVCIMNNLYLPAPREGTAKGVSDQILDNSYCTTYCVVLYNTCHNCTVGYNNYCSTRMASAV